MFRNLIGKVSIFVCSALVATSFLGAFTANADTTEKGTLEVSYHNGSSGSSSGRRFFNSGTSSRSDSFAIISMKESNGTGYTASYCMDYNKVANNRDTCTAGYTDVTNEEKTLLNYALLCGFSDEYSNPDCISTEDANLYYATQCAVWVITEGAFYDDTQREKLEEKFGANNAQFKDTYDKLYEEIKSKVELPDFASTDAEKAATTTLTYNETSKTYEAVIENIGIVKDAVCKSLPEGVTVDINNDKMTIKSTKELSKTPIKLTNTTTQTGGVECWGNAEGHQPQATIDKEEKASDYDYFVNVSTEKKKEIIQTPAPATQAPKTETIDEPKVPANDAPKATVEPTKAPEKSNPGEEEFIPKTSDSTPIVLIVVVLVLTLGVGVVFGIKAIRDKKKNFG